MSLHCGPGNGQAETEAAKGFRNLPVGLDEWIEDPVALAGFHADPGVGDLEDEAMFGVTGPDRDLARRQS